MRLKKLDRRMAGYGNFVYIVEFSSSKNDTIKFIECRRWCIEQFGQSVEYSIWEDFPEFRNSKWSWEREKYNSYLRCRLYLDEQASQWISLKWL